MPRLRCPQCSTVVDVAPGAAPVCTVCGFSGTAHGAAAAPPAKQGLGGGAVAAIVIAALLVLGGAAAAVWFFVLDDDGTDDAASTQPRDGPLSQSDAETLAMQAAETVGDLDALLASIDEPFLEGLQRVNASMTMSEEDEVLGAFNLEADLMLEWGLDNVVHLDMGFDARGDGGLTFGFAIEAYCKPDGTVVVLGDNAYEARPASDECGGILEAFDSEDDEDDDFDIETVRPLADGGVEVLLQNSSATLSIKIDNQARIVQVSMDDDLLSMTMNLLYGPLQAIAVPEASERLPANIIGFEEPDFETDGTIYNISSADDGLPRDEFTVRLVGDADFLCEDGTVVAEFPMEEDIALDDGFAYEWRGDGDATVESGDAFLISKEGTDVYFDYCVQIYDEWADAVVGEEFLPGLSLWLLAGGLGAAAVVRRH